MKRLMWLWLMVCAVACTQGEDVAKEPVWGKQACGHCAMLLSEQDHGAQATTTTDERLYFDDLGCLIAWDDANPKLARHKWVHTSDSHAWLPIEQAGFAPAAHTPMDFGFVALAKPSAVTWQQVTEAVRAKLRSH